MAYNIDVTKASVPEALELLTDAVLNPKFQSWEVAEQARRQRGQAAGRRAAGCGCGCCGRWLACEPRPLRGS